MDAFAVEQLDFSELQAAMDEILNQSFSFQDTVLALLSGEQPFTMESFLRMALSEAGRSFAQEKQIFISILVLGIAAALLTNFTNLFKNDQIGEISFEMTYLLLFLLLLQIFTGAAELAGQVLSSVQSFMKALLPAWCLAVTLSAGSTTALVFYQFMLGLIYLLDTLVGEVLLPVLNLYMMLVFVNHLTKEEYLSQMTELTGKGVGWLLKTLLAAVVGFNAIQGMITPALDALKNTAFTRALRVLPGIGNVAGGVTDLLLGSAVLLKNGVGAAAVLVLALICLGPLVKLGVLFLLLKGTAALIQPVCDKRFVGCVAGAGEGVRLLFQAVFTVTVLFVLTIVVVTVSVRL